jgi:hypothetical protein
MIFRHGRLAAVVPLSDVPADAPVDDLDIEAATSVNEYLWVTNYAEGRKDKA